VASARYCDEHRTATGQCACGFGVKAHATRKMRATRWSLIFCYSRQKCFRAPFPPKPGRIARSPRLRPSFEVCWGHGLSGLKSCQRPSAAETKRTPQLWTLRLIADSNYLPAKRIPAPGLWLLQPLSQEVAVIMVLGIMLIATYKRVKHVGKRQLGSIFKTARACRYQNRTPLALSPRPGWHPPGPASSVKCR
jgi:hypothetical protein